MDNISIVIPTFNRKDYLVQCIESCLKQTKSCEIIVCDHGSTDSTPEVMQKYIDKITYVRRELDSGVHFAWLDGILHAKNEWIHINFDDDWIEPEFIEVVSEYLNHNVGCVFTNAKLFIENLEDRNKNRSAILFSNLKTGIHNSSVLEKYSLNKLASPGAGVFRKQILIDCLFQGQIPFTKYSYRGVGPDLLFSLVSASKYKKFGFINRDLAVFRAHESSITTDAGTDKFKTMQIAKAYDEARIFYIVLWIFEKFNCYELAKIALRWKRK